MAARTGEAAAAASVAAASGARPLRILVFTTLFPNTAQPSHGIFVETRLRHLLASGRVEARVVAPVPWFPLRHPRFGDYAAYAAAPRREERIGITVDHPRYLSIPRVGMTVAPATLYASAVGAVRRLVREGFDFDLIDAHYVYPDGIAAVRLAQRFGRPVTITARGTDLNLIPQYPLPRRMIRWAAGRADGLITVCQALKDSFVDLGVAADKVRVLRNGVDLVLFHPEGRAAARAALGLGTGPVLASVGLLIERKGHDITIRALAAMPGATLLIAGDGPDRNALEALAVALGVADRVRFLGRRSQTELRTLYAAADALVLASSREGWANVLLEAMACGTPVVASNVWGTPEVVAAAEAGRLMAERTPEAAAAAIRALLADPPPRAAVRAYAERFDWADTTRGQIDLFTRIIAAATAPRC